MKCIGITRWPVTKIDGSSLVRRLRSKEKMALKSVILQASEVTACSTKAAKVTKQMICT